MGRNKSEINPNCGKRLRKLLKDNNVTATELAKRVHCTQQHLSRVVTGKSNLSYETASVIVKEFPGTRVGWLLGIDDCETDRDVIGVKMQEKIDNCEAAETLIEFATSYLGYSTVWLENTKGRQIDGIIFQDTPVDIDEYNQEVNCYLIRDSERIEMTNGERGYILEELTRYSVYLLNGLILRKNNKWRPFSLNNDDIKENFKNG